jgi:ABC-2 type transport system ATP-binding protein
MYDMVTGWQFVLANAKLHRLPNPKQAAEAALALVDMLGPKDRQIAGYSKGMKQRVKMAASLVHQPAVLLLDEPFNGMDPMQREHLMDLMRRLGSDGYTVLFSSHVLEEVEQIAQNIEVVVTGRHAASGDFRAIRRLMTERPLQYRISSSNNRWLAAALVGADQSGEAVQAIDLQPSALNVEVRDVVRFSHALPALARSGNVRLFDVSPADESLESVFAYLVNRQSRSAR